MASSKFRAAIGIMRVLVGIGLGYMVYSMWSNIRAGDEWYYPFGAGLVTALMATLLLDKLKGGGD